MLFFQLAWQTEMEGFVNINVGFKSKLEQLIVIEAWEVQTVMVKTSTLISCAAYWGMFFVLHIGIHNSWQLM